MSASFLSPLLHGLEEMRRILPFFSSKKIFSPLLSPPIPFSSPSLSSSLSVALAREAFVDPSFLSPFSNMLPLSFPLPRIIPAWERIGQMPCFLSSLPRVFDHMYLRKVQTVPSFPSSPNFSLPSSLSGRNRNKSFFLHFPPLFLYSREESNAGPPPPPVVRPPPFSYILMIS